ncbi:MAG: ATP-binding protein, partial [Bradyrhizobium sp.]|uniref:ATP-binding protein n=1 Tax=Bradyrhizobium sp. TaxID=376 RepID=UPI0011FB7CB3
MKKPLRIFISSPGDVVPERRRAALTIEKLAKDYSRFFEIKPYLWETETMLASGTFQDAIVTPGDMDILVLILWSRLGTPLPERTQLQVYRGIDGRVPVTGTEWEFETALSAYRLNGAPDLLAYKKGAPPRAEYRSQADLEGLREQLRKLESFWSRHFVDRGEFRAAFSEFDDLDGFEAKLEIDLRRLIERRIATFQTAQHGAIPLTWTKGSPFRGLATYRFEHAPIFFGRSEATKVAVEHLVENAEAGLPFLLVLGASGAGKSSLVQAGILPALGAHGVVPGVAAWRRAVIRPAGHPGGPFMALASGICEDSALPELANGQDVGALARHLEAAIADASFPIVAALTAREHAARQKDDLLPFEEIRLIVVVDQLEELFTLSEMTPDRRSSFIACLKGLMSSRRVFVIATMRSDYWHRAAEIP